MNFNGQGIEFGFELKYGEYWICIQNDFALWMCVECLDYLCVLDGNRQEEKEGKVEWVIMGFDGKIFLFIFLGRKIDNYKENVNFNRVWVDFLLFVVLV